MLKQVTNLFNEKNFTIDNVIENREGIKDIEKSSLGSVIKSVCWAMDNKVTNQHKYILAQVQELKDMLESSYVGTDSHDYAVERKKEYIEHLMTTEDEVKQFKDTMYQIHKDVFGTEYVKPSKSGKTTKTDTASTLEAKQLLAKFDIK